VEEATRWYLIDELSRARGDPASKRDDEKQRVLGRFAGVLAGFRYLGAITEEEERIWSRKMFRALGYDLPDPPAPGSAQFISLGDPAQRPEPPHVRDRQLRTLFRTMVGPRRTIDFYGGTLRILGVDLYDTAVEVRWRLEPDLDIWQAFPEAASDLEEDLAEVTDDWAVTVLRQNATDLLRRVLIFSELSDDMGTPYALGGFGRQEGGGIDAPGWTEGHHAFRPTPPTAARKLRWTWLNTTIAIPLP
jgi:hypothetical protein